MFPFHSLRLWKMRPCRRKSLYSRPRKHSAAAGCDRRLEFGHKVPSLAKEGWLRPLKKCREATLAGADGVVCSKEIVLEFERTTPSAPFKGTGIFFDGASTPPLPRRGVCFAQAFSKIKCVYFPGIKPAASNFDTTEIGRAHV